ncbi:serine/threonine protein kinase [Myxococcota bacterium]|nr:serine/threonine protein kinase [Myxococcota bacterium]
MNARRYQIMEPIGQGSFGSVYRARLLAESGFTKDVAVKILRPEVSGRADLTQRLRDEARLLGLLRHRAILQVDGLVRIEAGWAMVMEYIEGVNLMEATANKRLPLPVALEIIAEVASALHAAWSQPGPDGRPLRLIHRDIKPSNLQLTATGSVKLLDFGVARADFQRESSSNLMLVGSFGYMAPERLDSVDGAEGDIYALGVVLYEMIVGERLGRTSSNIQRHNGLREAALRQVATVLGDPKHEVLPLISSMLAYEAKDRPTARAVELAARKAQRAAPGESLSEWADRIVPYLREGRSASMVMANDLSGMTLSEQSARGGEGVAESTFDENRTFPMEEDGEDTDEMSALDLANISTPPPAWSDAPPPQRRTKEALLAFTAVVLAALIMLGAARLGQLVGARRIAAYVPAPVAVALVPEPVVEEPPVDEGEAVVEAVEPPPPPVAAPVKVEAPPAPPVEATPPPEPTPPKEPEAQPKAPVEPAPGEAPTLNAGMGQVTVAGDDGVVALVNTKGRYKPGQVPAGRYEVFVSFGGRPEVRAGAAQVGAGQVVVVTCREAFMRCSAAAR